MTAHLAPADVANLLAAKAVALAQGFLAHRVTAAQLREEGVTLFGELLGAQGCTALLDPARLLTVAVLRAAGETNEARRARWCAVVTAFVDLLRDESLTLRDAKLSERAGR